MEGKHCRGVTSEFIRDSEVQWMPREEQEFQGGGGGGEAELAETGGAVGRKQESCQAGDPQTQKA